MVKHKRGEKAMKKEGKNSPAKLRAIAKYDAKTAAYFSLKMNRNTDSDIIEWLASKSNKQGYLKDLIRADMDKNK